MLPESFQCPRCRCRACYALHRKGIDWVYNFLGLRPARCLTCMRKFYTRYELSQIQAISMRRPTEAFRKPVEPVHTPPTPVEVREELLKQAEIRHAEAEVKQAETDRRKSNRWWAA